MTFAGNAWLERIHLRQEQPTAGYVLLEHTQLVRGLPTALRVGVLEHILLVLGLLTAHSVHLEPILL